MLCDFHTHTHWSYDSEENIDNSIHSAISMGMRHMAITDHHDFDLDDCVFEQKDPRAYYNDIYAHALKYSSQIDISVGIELGIDACQRERLYKFTSSAPFDFIIGSIHGVEGLDPYYDNYWEGISTHEGMIKYFDAILEGMEAFDDFDVLGHIDYAIRYARVQSEKNYDYDEYADRLDAILKKVISMGKGIEINTAGLRKGLNTTNPSEQIIRKYREFGGKIITVGSDAHFSKDVGADFEAAGEILKRCGFTEYCIFKKREAIFLPL